MDAKFFKKVSSEDPSEEKYNYWRKMLHVYINKDEVPDDSKLDVPYVFVA